jgi:hypothetical protein
VGRHPLAATGFLFVMRSTAFDKERDTALRRMDLLEKLAQEPDAYDATGIIITEWQDPSGEVVIAEVEGKAREVAVSLRHDLIPDALCPDLFLSKMISCVLNRTPINRTSRLARAEASRRPPTRRTPERSTPKSTRTATSSRERQSRSGCQSQSVGVVLAN